MQLQKPPSKRTLAHNAFWSLLGQGLSTLARGIYFVVVAAALGPEQYGAFAGVLAVVSILSPLAPFGTGFVLVQDVARDTGRLATAWGNSILITIVAGAGLTFLLIGFHSAIFPVTVPVLLIGFTALAEIVLTPLSGSAGQAFQAFERLDRMALLQVLVNLSKLMAAVGLALTTSSPSALHWSGLYLLSALVSATIGLELARRELGVPRLDVSLLKHQTRSGAYFALDGVATVSYHEADKAMLVRLSTFEATGVYSASQRLIEVAFVPVRSVLMATLASFFRGGSHGIAGSVRLMRRIAPLTLGYSLAIGLLLFGFAPLAPSVFGSEYESAITAIRWLSAIPVLKTLHSLAGDALTGAGYQWVRSYALLAAALTNILANLWLIREYSWQGAVWTRIATEAALVCMLWGVTWRKWRHQSGAPPAAVPP